MPWNNWQQRGQHKSCSDISRITYCRKYDERAETNRPIFYLTAYRLLNTSTASLLEQHQCFCNHTQVLCTTHGQKFMCHHQALKIQMSCDVDWPQSITAKPRLHFIYDNVYSRRSGSGQYRVVGSDTIQSVYECNNARIMTYACLYCAAVTWNCLSVPSANFRSMAHVLGGPSLIYWACH